LTDEQAEHEEQEEDQTEPERGRIDPRAMFAALWSRVLALRDRER
jgi:hypothetical protein